MNMWTAVQLQHPLAVSECFMSEATRGQITYSMVQWTCNLARTSVEGLVFQSFKKFWLQEADKWKNLHQIMSSLEPKELT
jgi:hypothetical protein